MNLNANKNCAREMNVKFGSIDKISTKNYETIKQKNCPVGVNRFQRTKNLKMLVCQRMQTHGQSGFESENVVSKSETKMESVNNFVLDENRFEFSHTLVDDEM